MKLFNFSLDLSMALMNAISKIDRFDASWSSFEKREGYALKHLKAIATVRSVGASTRIEGSKMTDPEVEILLERLKISKLEERDQQEVAGYFETLELVSKSFKDIQVTEGNVKNLHKLLLGRCDKDHWHKGEYKQVSNAVEATHENGSKHIIFQTTEPGWPTQEAMSNLFQWYHSDKDTHVLIKAALFVYEFLSIHPFQDGNGRLSRLLGTLLLLRSGYSWIQYVSFEHEIENRKSEYYHVLMQCQKQRPGEPVDLWVSFFFDCLNNIQVQLMEKLKKKTGVAISSPRERNILKYIENHPGAKSGEIAEKLHIPLPSVKRIIANMVETKAVAKYGSGAGTNYIAEEARPVRTDLVFRLKNKERVKHFLLLAPGTFVEIKKIILTPLFPWQLPDEWASKMTSQGLCFNVICNGAGGKMSQQSFLIGMYNSPYYFQPVFTLHDPVNIPTAIVRKPADRNEYPIQVEIELAASAPDIDFEVMFVYDECF